MIYKTDIDLKETFYKMNKALADVEVKGDSVEIIYSARLTLRELFEKTSEVEEDDAQPKEEHGKGNKDE